MNARTRFSFSVAKSRRSRGWLQSLTLCCVCLFARFTSFGAEVIPPPPERYFNDYAHVTSGATAERLNQTLESFERQTSSQILVVVYPKMQSDSSIEDYTVRVAQSWIVGQKERKNGAVLFVFTEDRKLYLQVGYGLEGALPDALAKRIIENEIKPRFREGDFDGGLTAGVNAILAATRGEYKGTGRTAADNRSYGGNPGPVVTLLILGGLFALFILMRIARRKAVGTIYEHRGYTSSWGGWSSGWSGGGWSSGGGGGGGGGGGFSGGGGSFGGGGAGGSW